MFLVLGRLRPLVLFWLLAALCVTSMAAALNADQIIAQTEIDDAIAAHGNAMKIHDAQVEMGRAATERANGHFDAAVDHYSTRGSMLETPSRFLP